MVNINLFESFLYQAEGTSLDFKQEQYRFIGADDKDKSELLKDVIAFANSWRQGDAYILIGVKAITSGRHEPVGIDPGEHFDDAQLQQFINSKTNRAIEMSYEVVVYNEASIGIIKIAKKKRPFYAKKDFGKVKKEIVYYRLGSSTAIANPEDIALMGEDAVNKASHPTLSLEFADLERKEKMGDRVQINSVSYAKPSSSIPSLVNDTSTTYGIALSSSALERLNPNYYREQEKLIRISNLCSPVGFFVYNSSSTTARQVKVEITGSSRTGVKVLSELPRNPERKQINNIPIVNSPFWAKSMASVSSHGDKWTINIEFGDVQPKSTVWLDSPLYIGSSDTDKVELLSLIYADNLPEPQKASLIIDFDIEKRDELGINYLKRNFVAQSF